MPRKIDEYIDALYKALTPDGADTYNEIRKRIARILGVRFSHGQTCHTLSYLRHHANIYNFTVPYVKRGLALDGEEHRFFILDAERDPDFAFDAEYRANFDNGCYDTVASVERFCANLSIMLESAKQHEPLRPRKEYLDDFKEVMDFFARRAARLRRKVDDQRDDHAA